MRAARVAIAVAMLAGGSAAHAATPDCAKDLKLAIRFPEKVRITAAERVAAAAAGTVRSGPGAPPITAALPAFCRVSGTINERTGADGKPYAIGFQVALPEDWNGRLLFQGGGGLNGVLRAPLGTQATGDVPALAKGFAVVSTNGGHRSDTGFDYTFMADQQAALDFANSSLGTTTIVVKQIVTAHYGRAAHHSYMVGCSTGGREAMLASQRFPDLFDGIVSGAPAMRTGYSNIGTSYITAMLNRAATKDAAGKPTPLFPAADKALIVRAMLDDCDALDGLKDGVIAKAGACAFRPARIACKGAKTATCLSPAQVGALAAAFTPAKDAAGAVIYPSFPWDTGIVAAGRGIPGILTTGTPSPLGPPNLATEIDLDARVQTVRADGVQALIDVNMWTNLSTFLGHGGKIVWYHGVSDPWFSASDTADYYARATATNGPRFLQSSRLYMVPGAGHCGGGDNTFDQFDLLTAVVAWVEQGKAPSSVPAHRQLPTPADRPLCPFPSYPHYRGTGDEARAESFECRT
jgi:pimeloyl-ACP methyl ester carboxylesterase